MHTQNSLARTMPAPFSPSAFTDEVSASVLTEATRAEVLDFLAERPLHTVMMTGLIIDNGLVSPLNRGEFYGCRNRRGELEGVALIGHATLMETRTDRALQLFAELARKCTTAHMIMGESQRVDEFWTWYSEGGQEIRRALRECLLELRWPIEVQSDVPGLRVATRDDLDLILPVHAEMAFEESGVNPLESEVDGFRKRCARRIEQNRTRVLIESGKLIFKAEVVSDTPQVTYLEGVWINPEMRSEGWGTRCLSQLVRSVLTEKPRASVCVFVSEQNSAALRFYNRVGFKNRGVHDTVFLK